MLRSFCCLLCFQAGCAPHLLAASDVDWAHMPMDAVTGCNKGHAFFNFRSPLKVFELFRKLDGRPWAVFPSRKRCQVSYARVQAGHAYNTRVPQI